MTNSNTARPDAFQSTIAFMVTERCNLKCKHCILAAGAWGKDAPIAALLGWLDETAALGRTEVIAITGGEPFLVYDTLCQVVDYASSLGFRVSTITSGFWASSMERAVRLLSGLPALDSLGLSLDRFHQEFVPIEKIRTAIQAAKQLGIKTSVRVSYLEDAEAEIAEAERLLEGIVSREEIDSQPIIQVGRALQELAEERFYHYSCDAMCHMASKPVVDPDGNVYACCGPAVDIKIANPLLLGNALESSLTDVLRRADHNIPLQILRTRGPQGLWSLVRSDEEDLGRYDTTNACTLCVSLLSDPDFQADLQAVVADPAVRKRVGLERLLLLYEPATLSGLPTQPS